MNLTFYRSSVILLWLWSLFAIDLVGVAMVNMINLAVVLNYGIQCEMLRYYINTIGTRLKERSTNLKTSMKVNVFVAFVDR